ncbi:hypothetical protein Bca52824_021337 [Brassica carinata]|uniref:Uncharacterized protein n=1 Tax=Brassica carinata TaxID=52824 RepID=A0A8X7VWC1_BRACI|nr:hypothetical protein Bca52824_021337 [Brassica carinata]
MIDDIVSFSLFFLFSVPLVLRRKRRFSRPLGGSRRRLYGFLSLSLGALLNKTANPFLFGGSRRGRKTVTTQSVPLFGDSSPSRWLSLSRGGALRRRQSGDCFTRKSKGNRKEYVNSV